MSQRSSTKHEWPILWAVAFASAPFGTGIFGRVVIAIALVFALRRAHRAVRHNEQYWFTTLRWGVPVAALVLLGEAIKLMA